jgi:hypothetical protein
VDMGQGYKNPADHMPTVRRYLQESMR